MVPLMTIAEDVDCQATDSLDFDVPFVDPNAAIYFVSLFQCILKATGSSVASFNSP